MREMTSCSSPASFSVAEKIVCADLTIPGSLKVDWVESLPHFSPLEISNTRNTH